MGRVPEYAGDIFRTPEGSVIIHACNCVGSWGAGFAAALHQKFPAAYKVYQKRCLAPNNARNKQHLRGTALLIPPQEADVSKSGRYWIACLFTSLHFGARKDKPAAILENTKAALASLKEEIESVESPQEAKPNLRDKLWAVRINAKAFNTPWDETRKLLEESDLDIAVMNNLEIMSPAERKKTVASMQANGFDANAPPPFMASSETPGVSHGAEQGASEEEEAESDSKEQPADGDRKRKRAEATGDGEQSHRGKRTQPQSHVSRGKE